MQFQQAFPELKATPPSLPGQQTLAPSVLHQLRRQQLHDLARAFGLKVKENGTKQEILPILIEAEQRGVFQGAPVDDYWLRKAARSSDDRGVVLHGAPKTREELARAAVPEPVEEVETTYYENLPPERLHIGVLRRKAKEAGMKVQPRTKRIHMIAFLKGEPVPEIEE